MKDRAILKRATDRDHQEKRPAETTVFRSGDSLIVRIPVRFRRRCGRQMVLDPTRSSHFRAQRLTASTKISRHG
jgi:hypothetical protein